MKITQNQLTSIATAMIAHSTRIGSVNLSVDSLCRAVESGHPATCGAKFDTPKRNVLEKTVADVMAAYAARLTVADSVRRVLSQSARTAQRKDGTVYVQELTRVDCGNAKPAVAWLHRLRSYIGAIRRDGDRAVNAKTRKGLVAEFNGLAKADFAALNVCDDQTGFGLVTAKTIIGNMSQAEKDAVAVFNARNAAQAEKAQAETIKRNAKRNGKPAKTGKKHGVYTVSVDGNGSAKMGESNVKSKDAVFSHVDAATVAK